MRRLFRSPLPFWVSAIALAVLTGTTVSRLADRAASQSSRYGPPRQTVVALRRVEPGRAIRAADVAVRSLPATLVPRDALRSAPTGRTAIAPLFPGQVIVAAQVAPAGRSGIGALLDAGQRAVAVPTGGMSPPLRVGDVVDVLATFDPDAAAGKDPTFAVAEGATVLAVGDDAVTVAVSPAGAARVAYAITAGVVTLALSGTP